MGMWARPGERAKKNGLARGLGRVELSRDSKKMLSLIHGDSHERREVKGETCWRGEKIFMREMRECGRRYISSISLCRLRGMD